jgi:hypothetical protein
MKIIKNCLIIIFISFGITICLPAQVTVVGHITAEVVSTLTATEISQLSFGQFSPQTTGGKVILTPKGNRSTTGTVKVIAGTDNPGGFFVTGEPNAFISVELPKEPITLTNSITSGKMTVTSWMTDLAQQSNVAIPQNGKQQVNVGATLIVGDYRENPVGMYKGTYNITFHYN